MGQERNERVWEAELQRQTGEVLLAESAAHVDQAKRHFRQAIAIARAHGTRAAAGRARDLAEAREFFASEAA